MKKFLIIFSVAIFLSGILHFSGYGIPGSALICRFVHMILGKQELFQPEILEEFHFWEKGYTKTIQFNPKYAELYSIGFLPQPQDIPATYQYKGTLKLEIYSNNRLLYEATITEPKTVTYKERDTNFIKEIAFEDFEVPLKGRRRDLILKLTVVEPDSTLERWKRSIRLFVGVSGTP